MEPLLPRHGGYRKLRSFQIAQLCYDITERLHRIRTATRRAT